MAGELLEKQYTANSKKGVVGNKGRKAPANPSPTAVYPIPCQMNFFISVAAEAHKIRKIKKMFTFVGLI